MTLADAVRAIVDSHLCGVPTFDALCVEVWHSGFSASATEIDAAARPYEVGDPRARRYERDGGPGHCPCMRDDYDGSEEHIETCTIPF